MPGIGGAGAGITGGIVAKGDQSAHGIDPSTVDQEYMSWCPADLVSLKEMAWGGVRAELRKRAGIGPDYVEVKIPQHAVFLVRRQNAAPIRWRAELSLNELAAIVDLLPHHFCPVFKQSTGLPPHRWQIQQRVERSEGLILDTDLSLAEIAVVAGFSDQSHFTTVFRKNVGATPSVWRRSARI